MDSGAGIKVVKKDIRTQDLVSFYQTLSENKMSIGVHKDRGQNNLQKAFWNEFGTTIKLDRPLKKKLASGKFIRLAEGTVIHTPARPFVRLTLYPESVKIIKDYFAQEMGYKIKGKLKNPKTSARNLLQDTADFSAKQMKKIADDSSNYLPNAPLTIAIKGYDYPLHKTGKLVDSIKGKVEKR